jgi:hypothetical protein
MASNHKRGQGSSWTVAPTEEEEEEQELLYTYEKRFFSLLLVIKQFVLNGATFSFLFFVAFCCLIGRLMNRTINSFGVDRCSSQKCGG